MRAVALFCFFCLKAWAVAAAAPNVILVMPDDLGYGDYSFLGNPVIRTPAVDQFSRQSLRFSDFQVSPTCSPTRSALMTGRHEFKNGVTHTIGERERLTLQATTLAQVLKSVGYATGIFGKWHLGDEEAYRPEKRGFDEVYIHGCGGIGQTFSGSCGDAPGNSNLSPTLWHNDHFEKTAGYCTDLFFEQAIRWIDGQRQEAHPFFAYVAPNAAHAPHIVPEEWAKAILPRLAARRNADDLSRYAAMVENIDANFGQLLQRLSEWQLDANTLVIYLGSDNGATSGRQIFDAGLRGGKNSPWQGGTRSWACWRWPGMIQAPAECSALTAHLDVFPTLAQLAGAHLSPEIQAQVEGRSLVPLLQNPKAPWADRLLFTHCGRWKAGSNPDSAKDAQCAVRNARYSLVNHDALYDLNQDLGEKVDVAPQHPEVVAELRARYDAWWHGVVSMMVNEKAYLSAPAEPPLETLYYRQFGGQRDPSAKARRQSEAE